MISAIVAMGENHVIGDQNTLPWYLPADLKHFKTITMGHPILMGRKTYESIGKPLPNRTNIILTRNKTFNAQGCLVVTSLSQAIEAANNQKASDLFIIGGAEVYQQCLPMVQRLYLTVVHETFSGDTFFPAIEAKEWQQVSSEHHAADANNPYDYSFIELVRTAGFST